MVGVEENGVTISLGPGRQGWTSKRTEPQRGASMRLKKESSKMTPPKETLKSGEWQAVRAWCRLVALGECSNEFVVREGRIKSARFVQGRERREAERN